MDNFLEKVTMDTKEGIDKYNERIVGMMADYGITMCEAMHWDFEGFEYSTRELMKNGGAEMVEMSFKNYLWKNSISYTDQKFFVDVFLGRRSDYKLKPIKQPPENST